MKTKATIFAIAGCAAGLGLFAGTSIGGPGESVSSVGDGYTNGGRVALDAAEPSGAARATASRRGKSKQRISHLISQAPETIAPNESTFFVLKCTKKQGKAVTGGGVLPSSGALQFGAISRFNPSNGKKPARTFFVGVINSTGSQQSFFPTLTCLNKVVE